MRGKKLTVATFNELGPAKAVKSRLENAGIPAKLYDESKLQRLWFFSKPLAVDKVLVRAKDFERARKLLEAADSDEGVLKTEVKCPQCGSPRVDYPQFTRRFITTTLVEVFCLLRVLDREFYCKNCHYCWKPKEMLRPSTDILNWPEEDHQLVKKEGD